MMIVCVMSQLLCVGFLVPGKWRILPFERVLTVFLSFPALG